MIAAKRVDMSADQGGSGAQVLIGNDLSASSPARHQGGNVPQIPGDDSIVEDG